MHVCLLLKAIITGCLTLATHDRLNKFYNFYIAAVVGVVSRRGIGIEVCHRN